MKLTNSLVNMGILKNNLKRFYLLAVASFMALFFSLPFSFYINSNYYIRQYERSFARNNYMLDALKFEDIGFFGLFVVCALAFVIALAVNRYLNTQNSSIFMHSLPVGKKGLYITNFVTGLILMISPIFLTGAILILQKYICGYITYRCVHVLSWMGISVLCSVFIYSLTNLVCMITGSTIFAAVLSAGLLSLEYLIGLAIIATLQIFVKGAYFNEGILEDLFIKITPFIRFVEIPYNKLTVTEIIVYILIIAIFFVSGLFIYKKRKNETATETISFNILKPIFKYVVTFLGGLSIGLLFIAITNYNVMATVIGYILGIALGYFISEIMIKQSIHVFGEYKGFLISILFFILCALVIKIDLFGYQNRIPKLDEIESADFRSNVINYYYEDGVRLDRLPNTHVTSLESIEKIRQLHKSLIVTGFSRFEYSNLMPEDYINNTYETKRIIYKLKNGKTIIRQYHYSINDNKEELVNVLEDDEYQYATYRKLFEYDEESFYNARIRGNIIDTTVYLTNKDKVNSLLEAIKIDVKNQTYSDNTNLELGTFTIYEINKEEYENYLLENPLMSIEDARLYSKEAVETVRITTSFVNTIKWFKENGYANGIIPSQDNIERAILYKYKTDEEINKEKMIQNSGNEMVYVDTKESYTREESFDIVLKTREYVDVNLNEVYEILENSNISPDSHYCLMIKFDKSKIDKNFLNDEYVNQELDRYYTLYLSKEEVPDYIVDALK